MKTLLSFFLLWWACAAPACGQILVKDLPGDGGDRFLVVRVGRRGSVLERWQAVPARRLVSRAVRLRLTDVVVHGGTLLLQSAHRLETLPADLSAPPRPLWKTARTLLRAAPFQGGWLALAAEGVRDGYPRGGRVYWITSEAPGTKRGAGATNGIRVRALSLLPRYNFWEMQVGDVDGDGRPEIALCTWSKTRLIPRYARRYFVYGWNGHDVFPRWRGSRLSKPYRQARLVRFDGSPALRLLSVEQTQDRRLCLVLYRWDDFGFTGLAQSPTLEAATLLPNAGAWPLARVRWRNGKETLCVVERQEDRLLLRRICLLAPEDRMVVGRFTPVGAPQLLVFGAGRAAHVRLFRLARETPPAREQGKKASHPSHSPRAP